MSKSISYCSFDNCYYKLKLTDFPCKCEKKFCKIHRLPEQHNCVYDYKKNNNNQEKIELMKCVSKKIIKI